MNENDMYVLEAKAQERVRMNLSQTVKGSFQMECTVESDSVERSKELLSLTIKSMHEVMVDYGLAAAGSV